MPTGLQTFGPTSDLRLDMTKRYTRLIHVRMLGATETGGASIAGFDATKGFAVALVMGALNQAYLPHQIRQSGNTVSWKCSSLSSPRVPSLLMVFMYA